MSGQAKAISIKNNVQKLNISVCILSKNDENLIEECIKSISDFAREIIVIDLGSTDDTVNIARKYTNRIYWGKWNKDWAEARNIFFKYAASEWVLFLDAYEKITESSKKYFNPSLLDKRNVGYIFKVNDMYHDKETESFSCRLFRRTNDIRFKLALGESVNTDLQRVSRKSKLAISPTEILIDRYIYQKYLDDSEFHEERLEISRHALKNESKLAKHIKIYYRLCEGLSLGCLGEYDDAEEIILEVLEQIQSFDKNMSYNIPSFMQVFLFLCFKYSKKQKYKEALDYIQQGVEIYHNSLTLLIRYAEQLYMNNKFKETKETLDKIRELIEEEEFYYLEEIDFNLINKLYSKLNKLVKEKLNPIEENV